MSWFHGIIQCCMYSYKTCLAIDTTTRIRIGNDPYKTCIRLNKIQTPSIFPFPPPDLVKHNSGEEKRYEGLALNALLFTMIHIYTSLVTLDFTFQVVSWNPVNCSTSTPTLRGLCVQHSPPLIRRGMYESKKRAIIQNVQKCMVTLGWMCSLKCWYKVMV